MRCVLRSHYRDYKLNEAKIEDSQGMCGSEAEYDNWWNRVCSPNRGNVLRDVLRGLLVLIALAIVITVIFLLCYFLLQDIEHKEEEVVDSLIKDFATGADHLDVKPEVEINNGHRPNNGDVYSAVDPGRGDSSSGDPSTISLGDFPARLEEDGSLRNNFPEPATSPIEKADERVFKVEEKDPSFAEPDVTPLQSKPDSDLTSSDGSIVDSFAPEGEEGDQTYDVIPDFAEPGSETDTCVPLRLPLCMGSMPWTLTAFPNFVNNNNIHELLESLKYFQSTIVGSRCSTRAAEYTCAVLEPTCGTDSAPLPPCRAFCQDIVSTCSEYLVTGHAHNSAFICSRFPDSRNPNVCVDINREVTTEATEPSPVTRETSTVQSLSERLNEVPVVGRENVENEEVVPKVPEEPKPETVNEEDAPVVTEPPVFICDHSKFLCDDGSDCLDYEAVCDGIQHCLDNTDERNCTKPESQTTPLDVFYDDEEVRGEATTKLLSISHDNSPVPVNTQTTDDFQEPKPFSLSDMLSSSALLANPQISIPPQSTKPPPPPPPPPKNKLRFKVGGADDENSKANKGKAISSTPQDEDENTFSSFGPFPFTAKPIENDEERVRNSRKLSLADLLSSSSIAKVSQEPRKIPSPSRPVLFKPLRKLKSPVLPTKPPTTTTDLPPEEQTTEEPLFIEEEEPIFNSNQRSLSSLLSSLLPSIPSPRSRPSTGFCKELKCLDGTCISMSQLGDGIIDCPDGSDEKQGNHISLK